MKKLLFTLLFIACTLVVQAQLPAVKVWQVGDTLYFKQEVPHPDAYLMIVNKRERIIYDSWMKPEHKVYIRPRRYQGPLTIYVERGPDEARRTVAILVEKKVKFLD